MCEMDENRIDQYDLVEVIQVPDKYVGLIEVRDVGVVVEKYDDHNFEVECIQPGGTYKWLAALNIEHIRLKSRDPFRPWAQRSLPEQSLARSSLRMGAVIGSIFGAFMGGGLGAITKNLDGILVGSLVGLLLGVVTGAITAALTVRTAGTTGGVGVGYFTGMLFGAVFGMLLGVP